MRYRVSKEFLEGAFNTLAAELRETDCSSGWRLPHQFLVKSTFEFSEILLGKRITVVEWNTRQNVTSVSYDI